MNARYPGHPGRPAVPNQHLVSDFTEGEVRALVASIANVQYDDVCCAITIVLSHTGQGGHALAIVPLYIDDPGEMAEILRHSARHVDGTCRRCRV